MGRQGTLPSPLALLHPNCRHRRFHSNSSIHRGGTETESGGNLSKDPELLRAELSEVLGVLTSGPGLVGSGSIQNCFLFAEMSSPLSQSSFLCSAVAPTMLSPGCVVCLSHCRCLSTLLGAAEDVKEAQVFLGFLAGTVFLYQQFEKRAIFY